MKRKYFVLIVVFLLALSYLEGANTEPPFVVKKGVVSSVQLSIIDYGMLYLGTPYHYGAKGASFFDCSGFTQYVFRRFGYELPSNSRTQAQKYPEVKKRNLIMRDLVFFQARRRNKRVGHVGIVTEVYEDNSFKFLHASVSRGVTESSSKEKYYKRRYLRAARVLGEDALPVERVSDTLNAVVVDTLQTQSQVQTQPEPVVEENTFEIYTFQKGDTLYKIARKCGCTLQKLREWNPVLKTLIHIGDEIRILKKQ